MTLRPLVITAALAWLSPACTDNAGEPIHGTIAITVGPHTISPTVGAAFADPEAVDTMVVIIGTDAISCSTDLHGQPGNGTYVLFGTARDTLGSRDAEITVLRSSSTSGSADTATGSVTIDTLGSRVTGSLSVTTTNDVDGDIAASGTFDVISCL